MPPYSHMSKLKEHIQLWERIRDFEMDDPEASFSFTDRLCREQGWSMQFAMRAVAEYKKFMLLIAICDHPCTPSEAVDEVWHLHLIYTRSYWKHFCGDTLGREVHHEPTKGISEQENFRDLYEKTQRSYTAFFLEPAPQDIWPGVEERFATRSRKKNPFRIKLFK